jgi:soluble cytochrome b562
MYSLPETLEKIAKLKADAATLHTRLAGHLRTMSVSDDPELHSYLHRVYVLVSDLDHALASASVPALR